MRVGVFGGSFDPIHNAHLIVAQLASEQLGLDRLHIIVAGRQPHKLGHRADPWQRLEMVRIAAAALPTLHADDREILRSGPSYTVDTLAELAVEYPGSDLFLLVGADTATLTGWHEPERIRELARVVTFRRGREAPSSGAGATVEVPALELSSTAIRQRAAAGRSLRGWVPDGVADYISRLGLYQG